MPIVQFPMGRVPRPPLASRGYGNNQAGPGLYTGQKGVDMVSGLSLSSASQQWANRPDDQRYMTLAELKAAVQQRKQESWTLRTEAKDLRMQVVDGRLVSRAYDITRGEYREMEPTHWAFGQLSQYASAPASYLRKLPPQLAAINLQYGLERMPIREETLVLGQTNGDNVLRAMTSTSYGRIWDIQVVESVERVNDDGRWVVPAASYTASNPKRATTLYASDRDVFIFLVDPLNPIAIPGDDKPLYRGFYTWNSEVGSAVFGLTTFLYRYVCDNRIIWGATDIQELRIRHTGGAPERFSYEGARYLRRYAEESTSNLVGAIERAKGYELPVGAQPDKGGWEKWLAERGFTDSQAKNAVATAKAEEGEARSLWDIINGVTAYARSITHTDDRVKLETQAGKLMRYVGA